MDAQDIWQATLERMQPELSAPMFATWFGGTVALSLQDGVLTVLVPTTFAKSQLEDRFREPIRTIVSGFVGETVDVQFREVSWQGEGHMSEDITQDPEYIRGYEKAKKAIANRTAPYNQGWDAAYREGWDADYREDETPDRKLKVETVTLEIKDSRFTEILNLHMKLLEFVERNTGCIKDLDERLKKLEKYTEE